ncbi:MAG: hypothetical protein SPJ13_03890 [Bacteroidales bacterium]|nr:hypothetical protein [Bacteroidales bacterium]
MKILFNPDHKRSKGNSKGTYKAHYGNVEIEKNCPVKTAASYNSEATLLNEATFAIVNAVLRNHRGFLNLLFDKARSGSTAVAFYRENKQALRQIFAPLAKRLANGERVDDEEAEQALRDYAATHPNAIVLGKLTGYRTLYLCGAWPKQVRMYSLASKGRNLQYLTIVDPSASNSFAPQERMQTTDNTEEQTR